MHECSLFTQACVFVHVYTIIHVYTHYRRYCIVYHWAHSPLVSNVPSLPHYCDWLRYPCSIHVGGRLFLMNLVNVHGRRLKGANLRWGTAHASVPQYFEK